MKSTPLQPAQHTSYHRLQDPAEIYICSHYYIIVPALIKIELVFVELSTGLPQLIFSAWRLREHSSLLIPSTGACGSMDGVGPLNVEPCQGIGQTPLEPPPFLVRNTTLFSPPPPRKPPSTSPAASAPEEENKTQPDSPSAAAE